MKKIIIRLLLTVISVLALFYGFRLITVYYDQDRILTVLDGKRVISNFSEPLIAQEIPVENLKINAAIDAEGNFYFTRDIMIGYSHEFIQELWNAKLDVLKFAENTSHKDVPYGIILVEKHPRPIWIRGVMPVGIKYPNTYVIESVTDKYQTMYAIVTFSGE